MHKGLHLYRMALPRQKHIVTFLLSVARTRPYSFWLFQYNVFLLSMSHRGGLHCFSSGYDLRKPCEHRELRCYYYQARSPAHSRGEREGQPACHSGRNRSLPIRVLRDAGMQPEVSPRSHQNANDQEGIGPLPPKLRTKLHTTREQHRN